MVAFCNGERSFTLHFFMFPERKNNVSKIFFPKNKIVRCETRNPIARVLETAGFWPKPLVGPALDLVTTGEIKQRWYNALYNKTNLPLLQFFCILFPEKKINVAENNFIKKT